jgi:8-oxo-dGTP diphosphatase
MGESGRGNEVMDESVYKKVVIIFLHNNFDSYLLQLRDFKSSIIYPGHWGAFGGGVEEGESPIVAMDRELTEEIGCSPEILNFYREIYIDKHRLNIHIFYSSLGAPLSKLNLMEGVDMGLFTIEEILSKNLYSHKLGKKFPVVPLLLDLFDDFFEYIGRNKVL